MSSQQPFPQYPEYNYGADPAATQGQQAPTEQPPSIRTAVLLMRIGAAVSLLSLLVSPVTIGSLKDDIRNELTASGTTFTESDVDTFFNVAVGLAILFGLIGVALWLWMAWANGRGKKWARVVSTVLAGLGLLTLLFSLGQTGSTTVGSLLTLVTVALGVVAVFLLYRPDSSAFCAANSRR
jgi:hypothetical protein